MNNLKPVVATMTFLKSTKNENGGAIPYIIGWLMGVPLSILLLIAMMRAIF